MTDKSAKRIARKLQVVYEEHNRYVDTAVASQNATCRKGCASCCNLLVSATVPEALAIVDYISQRPALWERFLGAMPLMKEQIRMLARKDMSREKYWAQQQPCTFLNLTTKECTIYPVRPSVCRSHVSIDDPEKCDIKYGEGLVSFLNLRFLDEAVWKTGQYLMKQRGLPLIYGPFPLVLLWAAAYYVEGEHKLKNEVAKTPYAHGDMAGTQSWLHLAQNDVEVQNALKALVEAHADETKAQEAPNQVAEPEGTSTPGS